MNFMGVVYKRPSDQVIEQFQICFASMLVLMFLFARVVARDVLGACGQLGDLLRLKSRIAHDRLEANMRSIDE